MTTGEASQSNGGARDFLHISNSDQPVTQLTNKQFDGENFIAWSRQARLALAAKQKLGFVTGRYPQPDDPIQSENWLRNDSMVFCWILNSLIPYISSTFLYSRSSKELWEELHERYGQANGPLIFQLRREMANTTQGDDHVPLYFSKLKRVWDEYQAVEETIPTCSCGVMKNCKCNILKKLHDLEMRNQLLQFLMGLSSKFDQIRGHILAMEPLPPLNKAYQMIQQDDLPFLKQSCL